MTYSVVARDKKTGQLWICVQTHWFWVGNIVPWLESWIWAIATQSQTNMDYGKKGIKLLGQWKTPDEAFHGVADTDEAKESRQVAIMDIWWNIYAHTWDDCIKYADSLIWDNFIVQGNILTNEDVLPAMKKVYEDNMHVDFAERLYLCVKAGEDMGWELRGVQSAALRIVPWEKDMYDIINIRIDDDTQPLSELKRQLNIQRAYHYLNDAEEEGARWSIEASLKLFTQALNIIPHSKEFLFWKAFMLRNKWEEAQAQAIFEDCFEWEEKWIELWNRIP